MTAYVWKANNSVKNITHLCRRPPRFWGPRLQPAKPIGKSGTEHKAVIKREKNQIILYDEGYKIILSQY